jgi:hypothetical protein
MAVDCESEYNEYINKLATTAKMEINSFEDLIEALQKRHNSLQRWDIRLLITAWTNFLLPIIPWRK